uniref:BHLH domain-containing protein n=1 Tax=Anopheles atroparvus TaxID=41427 RepID=A0AAG5D558_ANOAO
MMSLVEVWNKNEESSTSVASEEHQQQQQQDLQEHYQSQCMQLDTMQDIICEEETVRYVHVKSEDGSGGNNNNNSSINNNNNGINSSSSNSSNNLQGMDKDEKRMRREIANSNERRRMQSINAGFQSLRQMLPHHEGEK